MDKKINPFHELYVTESIGDDAFVRLFSNVLVDHALALFKPGNVILKGLPGTGKSMMLSLLKPSIRLAYKRANQPFPIPNKFAKFIGAGINLIRSSVSDFGQRPISEEGEINLNELAVYFGDFLNYWIVKDILDSIEYLEFDFSEDLGINLSEENKNSFANNLKKDDVWFGFLEEANSYEELKAILRKRIISYRSFFNYNSDKISDEIIRSKTAVGSPIAVTANYLRESGIISNDTQIFIQIDQYEELVWLDNSIQGLGSTYQSVIHKLLAMRDASISFRIGTRPFAWNDQAQSILGTTASIEAFRNYVLISIDDVLRRPENIKTYIFPNFAEDIFTKRLKESGYNFENRRNVRSTISEVFGDGMSPTEKALKYMANSKERAIEIDPEWPESWTVFLKELASRDPLSARLGEAWARQSQKKNIIQNPPTKAPYPWDEKKYWKKERIDQALIQLASRNRQQLIWEGRDDILKLSGGNILAFLSLCQQIWEVWMRDTGKKSPNNTLPKLDTSIQTLGILETSSKWYESISTVKGGKNRKSFISYVGTKLYKKLVDDSKMSYPGHNGFSVKSSDLEKAKDIDLFLKDSSDYGDLQVRPHTTKNKAGESRTKWYLNPIFSPRFKLPVSHTKEPYYISLDDLSDWLSELEIISVSILSEKKKSRNKKNNPSQGNLFF
jgi:hypothetical protein